MNVKVIMPPLVFSSEALVALSFIKALRELGVDGISCVYEKEPDSHYISKMSTELVRPLSQTRTVRGFMIKGPLISSALNYVSLKSLSPGSDLLINLYFREYPLGLDLAYILYPHPILHKTNRVRQSYRGVKRPYFALTYRLIRRLAKSKRPLCSSEYIREVLQETHGMNCEVLHPPVIPPPGLKPKPKRKLVIGVGKYLELKRWEDFIQVAKLVKERDREVEFKVIGGFRAADSSPGYFERLKREAEGVVELMTDVGEEEKWDLLFQSRVILHCQRLDNFGLGVAEAMYAGSVPVVYRSTGPWSDNLQQGKYGLSFLTFEEARDWVLKLMEDQDFFSERSEIARSKASQFTYYNFKERVKEALEVLV